MRDKTQEGVIGDEAHRPKDVASQYKGESMVEDMVRAARVSVFFLGETRRVQWIDSGSEERIREVAKKFEAHVHAPFTLTAQLRCGGSDSYLNRLDAVLQLRPTGNFDKWADEQYQVRVCDDAQKMYAVPREKNANNKALLSAG